MTKDSIDKMGLRELRGTFVEFCGKQGMTSLCWRFCPVFCDLDSCTQLQWLASISEREIRKFLSGMAIEEETDNAVYKEAGSN